ncbi:glyceraldehyde-3-phosphate dehydrogenase [Roseibium album]|uniref:Glyceraldehyde-3-phosphate dehydrogenase n=1 Tax=Roseibium album TaxID=311410 RepID=A0A0M6ZUI5_9HYPH|nr:glyceraldehyde-3-phosphate dehydrogenase [Roseibium album]CTQ58246.1 Glyceraldehyde-3-phosphate dehydrogenase [Roseibium album]CTQ65957.1 Glyceraldehyde-3-phosphate dehydrogenase [Roseibium album]CTQ70883.1 Glyceraldehyde-3-phosphate dehydrogenase [Roseibium album]
MAAMDNHFDNWKEQQSAAEQMIPLVGHLYRDYGINIRIFGRRLLNNSAIEILKAHRYALQITGQELEVSKSLEIVKAMLEMDLAASRVDLGKLCHRYMEEGGDVSSFVLEQLASINTGKTSILQEPQDVVLYGFGRIGRLLARMLIERVGAGNKMRLRAIVVRGGKGGDLKKRSSLLRRDSVHGAFSGSITVDEEQNAIIANGNYIQVIYANSPAEVDYTKYGIRNALVVDNTGIWRDEEGLGQHLKCSGASKVILTAPGKGNIKNVVYGVNHGDITEDDDILSAASCTTNAITPVLKVINDGFGIENGHVETIHAFTNDQNLIDNYHKGDRRGRAAPLNMVLTSTGAASAVAKCLPEMKGKLTGNAVRVPVPNVSMAILNLNLQRETTDAEMNDYLRGISVQSPMQDQIDYTASTELVSSDLVGSTHAGVVDSQATIVDGNRLVLYVWYDNEAGYSTQVIRLMQEVAGMKYPTVPE